MGKRGPGKEPTHLKVVKGTASPDDEAREPTPLPDRLALPDDIDDPEVQAVWEYTVRQLEGMGMAYASDRDALVAYCEAVVLHRKASLAMKNGLLLRTQRGNAFMRNPMIAVQRDAASTLRAFAREFGLTPSARADFGQSKGNDGTGAERYLS